MAREFPLNNFMSNSKIKIIFVLPSLKAGGAERVISFIASNLNKQKFESTLMVIGKSEDAVYETEGIEVHFLGKRRVMNAVPLLFKYLFIKRPQIVMGSISHVNRLLGLLSFFFSNIKFAGREASVLSVMNTYSSSSRKLKLPIFKNYFSRLSAIICQSEDMSNDLTQKYLVPREKIYVINNPISGNLPLKSINSKNNRKKQLITIGRLSKEKGHERILKALSKVNFDFQYTIVGSGKDKDIIFQLAKDLDLFNKITYISHTKDIATILSKSDVFLQGSFVEGFPNALLESCVVGTPVIAFSAPGGTKEIIKNGVNGYIVEDESEFIKKINHLLFEQVWHPINVRKTVVEKFNKEHILGQYEQLFIKLANSKCT